jgi:hypothetical protein
MNHRGRVYVLSFGLVLAGCSFQASCGGKKLDTKKGEAELSARLQEKSGLPAKVTCPEAKLEKGVAIECTSEVSGLKGRIKVTQTDDTGNVSFDVLEGYFFAAEAERIIGQRLKEQTGVDGKVDCGERVRVSVPGTKIACTATAAVDGDKLALEVTLTDAAGGFDFKTAQ